MRLWALGLGVVLGVAAGWSCSGDGEGGSTSSGTGGGTSSGGGTGAQGGGTVTCIDGLQSITLAPDNLMVELDGSPASPITFTATGELADGSSVTIGADQLAWTATRGDDTPPGDIDDGVLTPYAHAGGVVDITATDSCVTGATTVVFYLDVTVGTPSDPGAWGGDPVVGPPAPTIVYPSDETRFPRNLYRTIFQWRSEGFTEFRLIYEGANSKVTVFTDGAHGLCAPANPPAGCWEVDEISWSYIASSNAGSTASWLVDALDTGTNPPTVRRSEAIELGFSLQDVEGAIFYWSTTSAGIRRGRISEQDPEDYLVGKPNGTTYSDPTDEVGCVACHVVSRDGQYLVAPVKSDATDSLWVTEVTNNPPPTRVVTDVPDARGHGFATISPDNEHVVVSFKKDYMWMVELQTGNFEVQLPTDSMGGGTHPDWSPLGDELVFATGNGDGPGDASLALIPWDGNAWGQPTILLAPPQGQTNNWPMFDPAGQWIAYSVGKGGHSDKTAQLMLVHRTGGTPIDLIKASRVTSNLMTDGQYQSSLPTWAPPGDYDWVAFNTMREYGVILEEGTQQIWVAAIDLDKAENGEDASYPAFRVPFQGLYENNHRAYWTLDIGQGGSGGAGGGGTGGSGGGPPCPEILSVGDPCDPLNDCCESGSYCDTNDSGETYECISTVPN